VSTPWTITQSIEPVVATQLDMAIDQGPSTGLSGSKLSQPGAKYYTLTWTYK